MTLIDIDKFVASFITEVKKNHMVITYNIPSCIKKALIDQGLEYKDGEIIKTQRRVSAEAKENGYGESEDEKTRKALISFLKSPFVNENITDEKVAPWLAWLEKQGEKPADWSEEDINKPNGGIVMEDFNDGNGFYKVNLAYLNEEQVKEIEELVKRWDLQPKGDEDESIISDLLDYFDEDKCLKHEVNDIVKWLKTIKQQQKGCGENEIKMLDNLITYLDRRKDLLEEIKRTYINFLKSLKQRSIWKPSDEQMKALDSAIDEFDGYQEFGSLVSLKEDLEKLKGG